MEKLTLSKKSEGDQIFLHIHLSFNFGETYFVGKILFQEIKRQADIGFRIRSIHSTLYIHRINSCNKWVERMAVMGALCSGQTGHR